MTPPEPSDYTIARPEYLNTVEAQENDFKNNFMKMIEAVKEEKGSHFWASTRKHWTILDPLYVCDSCAAWSVCGAPNRIWPWSLS